MPNMRESRGRAKQYTTINGRTVVVKDSFIYSNKGGRIQVEKGINTLIFRLRIQVTRSSTIAKRHTMVSRLSRAMSMACLSHLAASVRNMRGCQDRTSNTQPAAP